jgi:RNA polymerase sigma factor (sigma-70 family)
MAVNQMSEVIAHLRRAVLLRDGAGLTDGQLLEDYIRRHEEAALAALVHRHGPMVWGVCRRVLHNYHDAEDAFQATFLVLVRKAASVVPREMVANWLYGVAHQTALKARATTTKRRARERQVTQMPEPAVTEQDIWHDLQRMLDQELGCLPDKYRVAIVLCDLEGKTRKEAARQLGVPDGTLAARLARARRMLAKRLAGRGLGVSGAALAAVLSPKVASAGVPTSVVSSTIKAASLFAAGQAAATGAISAQVVALTEGVLKTMLLTKLKMAMAVLVTVALFGVGVGASFCGAKAQGAVDKAAEAPQEKKDQKPRTDKADAPKRDGDRDAVQQGETEAAKLKGKWKGVAVEIEGQALPKGTANVHVWEIADGKIRRTFPDLDRSEKGSDEVAFKIDPTQKPAHIDIEAEVAGKKTLMKGIYKIDGDELAVCLIGTEGGRPTEFSSSDLRKGEKGGKMLMKFNREKDAQQEKEQAMLQGDWGSAVSWIQNGAAAPGVEKRLTMVIKGDKMIGLLDGKQQVSGRIKIDPSKSPKHFDMTYENGASKGKTLRGIYKLEGDQLTICSGAIFLDGGKERPSERPSEFASKAGSNTLLTVHQRVKK